jgi:hypothetical protein
VLNSVGKLYNFNLENPTPVTPLSAKQKKENFIFSFVKSSWNSYFNPSQLPCPGPITNPYSCGWGCSVEYMPNQGENANQSGGTANCSAALEPYYIPTDKVLFNSSCSQGASVGENGGCDGGVSVCDKDDGTRVNEMV